MVAARLGGEDPEGDVFFLPAVQVHRGEVELGLRRVVAHPGLLVAVHQGLFDVREGLGSLQVQHAVRARAHVHLLDGARLVVLDDDRGLEQLRVRDKHLQRRVKRAADVEAHRVVAILAPVVPLHERVHGVVEDQVLVRHDPIQRVAVGRAHRGDAHVEQVRKLLRGGGAHGGPPSQRARGVVVPGVVGRELQLRKGNLALEESGELGWNFSSASVVVGYDGRHFCMFGSQKMARGKGKLKYVCGFFIRTQFKIQRSLWRDFW